MDLAIIDRGRGPEIAGTRVTVYHIVHYLEGVGTQNPLPSSSTCQATR